MIRSYIETYNRYKFLLNNLISRDFKVKYRRSFLGVLWSMLSPVMMMFILSAVFSMLLGNRDIHFPLYLMTGQTLFNFFNEATTAANFSIVDSASLIKKVYIPKYLFPVEKILFAFVNMLFSLSAVVVMLLVYRIPFRWITLLFPVPLISLLIFALGFGLILSALCVFFRDLKHLYSIIMMAWLYLTPIIYPLSMISGSWIRFVVYANPLTWYIEYFRALVLYHSFDDTLLNALQINAVCFGWAFFMLAAGLLIFRKAQDRFILHI